MSRKKLPVSKENLFQLLPVSPIQPGTGICLHSFFSSNPTYISQNIALSLQAKTIEYTFDNPTSAPKCLFENRKSYVGVNSRTTNKL